MQDPEDEGPRWGIFDLGAYTQSWDVPWGAKETLGGTALWAATFLGTAFLLAPALFFKLGSKVWRRAEQDASARDLLAAGRHASSAKLSCVPVKQGITAGFINAAKRLSPGMLTVVVIAERVGLWAARLGLLCSRSPGEYCILIGFMRSLSCRRVQSGRCVAIHVSIQCIAGPGNRGQPGSRGLCSP